MFCLVLEIGHLHPRKFMKWTRSNNPAELDAPPITMTVANQDHLNGLVAIYPTLKIRHCTYLDCTWEIIPWVKRYNPTDNPEDPFRLNPSSILLPMNQFPDVLLPVEWIRAR
jgi:hypothetical protein